MVVPLADLLKVLSNNEKEGRLRGPLSPSAEEALTRDFGSQWTEAGAVAFTCVKNELTLSPVLVQPDFAEPFEVVCDACHTPSEVGAVLLSPTITANC
jgi:hypothetical protein